MVQTLHFGVIPQKVEALAVWLPQELHPWSEQEAIRTVLSVLSTHGAQEHAVGLQQFRQRSPAHLTQHRRAASPFWGLDVVQVLNVKDHLLGLFLGSLRLLFGQFQVCPHHILKGFDVNLECIHGMSVRHEHEAQQPHIYSPAGRCSCIGRVLLWPGDSSEDPHRAPGIWAWWVRGSSAMFDVSCSWWHHTTHPRLAASYQPRGTLQTILKMRETRKRDNWIMLKWNYSPHQNSLLFLWKTCSTPFRKYHRLISTVTGSKAIFYSSAPLPGPRPGVYAWLRAVSRHGVNVSR